MCHYKAGVRQHIELTMKILYYSIAKLTLGDTTQLRFYDTTCLPSRRKWVMLAHALPAKALGENMEHTLGPAIEDGALHPPTCAPPSPAGPYTEQQQDAEFPVLHRYVGTRYV